MAPTQWRWVTDRHKAKTGKDTGEGQEARERDLRRVQHHWHSSSRTITNKALLVKPPSLRYFVKAVIANWYISSFIINLVCVHWLNHDPWFMTLVIIGL